MNNTSTKAIMKVAFALIAAGVLIVSPGIAACAFDAKDGVKAIYDYIAEITKVAGAILAIFGIIQISVSIGQTHDASQRMTGLLMTAGGALMFFATDILNLMGINP